ncbi:MAG: hypothetical protein AB2687_22715 [Candidatus Thiodiazotropha taylori]
MKAQKILSEYMNMRYLGVIIVLGLVGISAKAEYKKGDCRDCLIVDNFQKFHGEENWDVCQRDLPRCWKFRDEGFRDTFLKSYNSAKEGTGFHPSFFQDCNLFAKQDIHGNRYVYNDQGGLAYTSQYGDKVFKKNVTMTAELKEGKSCDDPIYDKAMNMKVTYFVDKRGNKKRRSVKFDSVGLIMTKNDKTAGSGIITGKNCDVLITANHVLEDWYGRGFDRGIENQFISQDVSSTEKIWDTATDFKSKSSGFISSENNKPYFARDWAVVELKSPAKKNCIRDLEINYGFAKKKCNVEYVLIGHHKDSMRIKYESYGSHFPADFNGELAKDSKGGALYSLNQTLIGHHLGTYGATSGSPILCKYKNSSGEIKFRLDGIHIDGVFDPQNDKPIHSLSEESHNFNKGLKISGDFENALRKALE